jgi:hypothetical protein
MQDWRETVRDRMDSHLLPSPDREQVIAELAAHVEERYQEARSRGLNDAADTRILNSSYSFGATYSFGLADPSPKKN